MEGPPTISTTSAEPTRGVSVPRSNLDGEAGAPAAAGRHADAGRRQLRPDLPARHGGLAGPLRAVRPRRRRRDPARPAATTAPATTGTSGSTACPRSSATATGSTGPRATATATTRSIVLLDPAPRALSCGRPWGTERQPAPPQPGERGDGRARRTTSTRASRSRTRSSTSCTSAASPSTRPRASATRAPSPAWSRRSPT